MSLNISKEEINKIFFDIWFSQKDAERGGLPLYLTGIEKVVLKALDDDKLRNALKENPEVAADSVQASLTDEEKGKLKSFVNQIDVMNMVNSQTLNEKWEKALENTPLSELPFWNDDQNDDFPTIPGDDVPVVPIDDPNISDKFPNLPTLDQNLTNVFDRAPVASPRDYANAGGRACQQAWKAVNEICGGEPGRWSDRSNSSGGGGARGDAGFDPVSRDHV